MTNSQRLFADISQNIAILRTEISQSGKLGLTDIHKQCENFIKHLLNRIYGYQLVNLNGSIANFPGLDIGDEQQGIAYQVSSERTSAKVDDMLDKVLRYRHYEKFPSIKLFLLSEKQTTYSINTQTAPFFNFNWKTDIVDFGDMLKVIQDLDLHQKTDILQFLQDELPYTLNILKGNEKPANIKKPYLINVEASLVKSGMPYYQHAVIGIRFLGNNLSTADLYKKLDKFYEGYKKSNLYLFNDVYRQPSTAQQIDFIDKLGKKNSLDYYKEGALRISHNQIIFEVASYTAEKAKLSPLIQEILALTTLLIFSNQLYGNKKFQIDLDFELATNNKLSLIPQNSHLHLINYTSWPILNPSRISFPKILTDVSNETLNSIYKQIIHSFVTEGNYGQPFMDLDEQAQNKASDWFRNYFAPTLQDLDD